MDIKNIFIMNAPDGFLLINSQNAEMLAVKREDILDAVAVLKNDEINKSCESFRKPLSEECFCETEIKSGKGIGIIPTHKCNFACEYCFEKDFSKEEMTKEMIPWIKKFVDYWNERMGCSTSYEEIGLMGGEVFREDNKVLMETIFQEFGRAKYKVTTNDANILHEISPRNSSVSGRDRADAT